MRRHTAWRGGSKAPQSGEPATALDQDNACKIEQNIIANFVENQCKIIANMVQKSRKIDAKIIQNRGLDEAWAALGPGTCRAMLAPQHGLMLVVNMEPT